MFEFIWYLWFNKLIMKNTLKNIAKAFIISTLASLMLVSCKDKVGKNIDKETSGKSTSISLANKQATKKSTTKNKKKSTKKKIVKNDNPKLFIAPLFRSQDDFKFERKLEFKPASNRLFINGSVIRILETKNTMRLMFIDSERPFSEVDFIADGVKRKTQAMLEIDSDSAKFLMEGDGRLELKKTRKSLLKISTKLGETNNVEMVISLPNASFLSTVADIDGKKLQLADHTAKQRVHNFADFKKITLRSETKENSFAILADNTKLNAKIEFGSYATTIKISAKKDFSALLDLGESKEYSPAPAPKGSRTKVAHVDFWEEENMILADTSRKNLLQNSSFEGGFQYLAFRHFLMPLQNEKLWEIKPVKITSEEAKFGKNSLEIASFPRQDALQQRITTASVPLEKGVYTFSVWAKSDSDGQNLTVSIAEPHLLYQKDKWQRETFTLTQEWARYEFTINIEKPQISPIVFEATSDFPAICRLDGMQLEKGEKSTKYRPAVAEAWLVTNFKNNLIESGKDAGAYLNLVSSPNAQGNIKTEIFDFFGEEIFSKNLSFECDDKGFAKVPLTIDTKRNGVFLLKTTITRGKGKPRYNIQRFTVAEFLENKHAIKNLFVDTYVDPLSTQQNFVEILDWYKKLGYGARAGYANRDNLISKTAQKYGIDSQISYVGRIQKDKKWERVLVFLENTNWFSLPRMNYKKALLLDDIHNITNGEVTPEYLKKVEEVSEYITKKYDGVSVWANVCEPEGTMKYFANPAFAKPEDFLKFVEIECAVARGVRKGNPNAKLSTSVTSTLARDDRILFFERLLTETAKRGIKYDCVGAHNYRAAPEYPLPTLEDNYLELFKVLKKHGYEKVDVLSPEGLHWLPIHCYDVPFITDLKRRTNPLDGVLPYTYDIGHGERLATALRARSWLVALKHDRIKVMNASNYGVSQMDADLSLYAYHKVPNTFGAILGNAKFSEELKLFPDTRCYIFNDKNNAIAVVWACKKEFDRGTQMPPKFSFTPPEKSRLFDLMHAEKSMPENDNGETEIQLSIFPIFIVAENTSVGDLADSLKEAKWTSNIPIVPSVKLSMAATDKFAVEIGNPYASDMKGKVSLRSESADFAIKPNGLEKFTFSNHLPSTTDKIKLVSEKIVLKLSEPKVEELTFGKSLRFFSIKKASQTMKIDGNFAEWKNIPFIELDNMRRAEKLWRNGIMPSKSQFSARYKACWQGDKLYVAIEVNDDKFIEAQGGKAQDAKSADSIEIILDPLANAENVNDDPTLAPDDWRYKIWKTKDSNVAKVYREFVPDVQMTLGILGAKSHTFANDVKGIYKKTSSGYILELEFSSDSILPFKVSPNATMGFGVIVNDSDDAKSPEADARLTNSASKEKIESLPSEFPKAIFVE